MDLLQLVLLALVQGITEFLPISSSAHLILFPLIFGTADQGLGIDVALHAGTLLAVMAYFRQDTGQLFRGGFQLLRPGARSAERTLALQVLVATLPVVIVGLLARDLVANELRAVGVIATTTIVFGLLLGLADRRGPQPGAHGAALTLGIALIIGCAQVLALVPGTSRSGITITVALLLGLARPEAARFALLLAIPTTAAATLLGGWEIAQGSEGFEAQPMQALLAAALAMVSAYFAIAWLMRFVRRASFMPFVYYRLALGVALFAGMAAGAL